MFEENKHIVAYELHSKQPSFYFPLLHCLSLRLVLPTSLAACWGTVLKNVRLKLGGTAAGLKEARSIMKHGNTTIMYESIKKNSRSHFLGLT